MEHDDSIIIFSGLPDLRKWNRRNLKQLILTSVPGVAVGADADIRDLKGIATSPQLFFQAVDVRPQLGVCWFMKKELSESHFMGCW